VYYTNHLKPTIPISQSHNTTVLVCRCTSTKSSHAAPFKKDHAIVVHHYQNKGHALLDNNFSTQHFYNFSLQHLPPEQKARLEQVGEECLAKEGLIEDQASEPKHGNTTNGHLQLRSKNRKITH
jgi:hypothetical protein